MTEAFDIHYKKGIQCLREIRYDAAIAEFTQALKMVPNDVNALNQLAHSFLMAARPRLALDNYKTALRLAPGNPILLHGMGQSYWAMGEFEKAATSYKKALKAQPDLIESLYNLVLNGKHAPNSAISKQLQKLHDSPKIQGGPRSLVCFSLGKIFEECGDMQRAFAYYLEANRERFAFIGYDEKRFFTYYDELERVFDEDLIAKFKGAGKPDATPIFVLGMPRSGTSLVEQILASHSMVFGAGEVDILPVLAERTMYDFIGRDYPGAAKSLTRELVPVMAEHYLTKLRSFCPDNNKPYVVDKTINNFFHIGLIRILFPNATIIHCVRDPMDTCWSLFKQHFLGVHSYSYDMTALGRYYLRYQQLMRHWHKVLPGQIYDLQYETLVAEPEPTIRALLGQCKLPWEDKCLSFYRTKRGVNTASALQVQRPIYKTSLKSWKPVAEQLAPLRAALGL